MLIQNVNSALIPPGRYAGEGAPSAVPDVRTAARADSPFVVSDATPTDEVTAQPLQAGDAKAPTPKQLQDAVEKMNNSIKEVNSNLEFSIDKDTQQMVVKVVEAKSGKVIKQIPSEDALAMAKSLDSFQQGGMLIQNKV